MSKIVAFSGSYNKPSKTFSLVENIAKNAAERHGSAVQYYDMQDLGSSLGLAQHVNDLDEHAKKIIDAMANADALIIGSPVYKGSYPGLFKHFFDLLDPAMLYGKPILLAASGGGQRHALMVEHQLRPLFGFFMAHSLPTAIYASSQDYSEDSKIISTELLTRINQAVGEFSPFIGRNSAHILKDYFNPLEQQEFQTKIQEVS